MGERAFQFAFSNFTRKPFKVSQVVCQPAGVQQGILVTTTKIILESETDVTESAVGVSWPHSLTIPYIVLSMEFQKIVIHLGVKFCQAIDDPHPFFVAGKVHASCPLVDYEEITKKEQSTRFETGKFLRVKLGKARLICRFVSSNNMEVIIC